MWDAIWKIAVAFIAPVATMFSGYLLGKLRESRNKDVATQNGVKALLKLKLIDLCDHYADAESVPPYAMENVLTIYDAYIGCGDGDPSVNYIVEQFKTKPIRRT